jgi:hypothetical protein
MMSDTSARARRFARWSGSFERNGFSGRLAPGGVFVLTGDCETGVGTGRGGATGCGAGAGEAAAGLGGGT